MKIGYAKLGRIINCGDAPAGTIGGDAEVINLSRRLLAEGHELHLLGRSTWNSSPRSGRTCETSYASWERLGPR